MTMHMNCTTQEGHDETDEQKRKETRYEFTNVGEGNPQIHVTEAQGLEVEMERES